MGALLPLIREIIAADGPINVARYMALALGHPVHGYYMTRDPLGRGGDFTTAPEISQMFGELIGLWVANVWIAMGRPSPVLLVELGPGRGTLMADALRAGRIVPGLLEALSVHLVETSPILRERQRLTLAGTGLPLAWHEELGGLPDGPSIVIANEFLDALPIRQFVRGEAGWHERLVGCDPAETLAFGLAREAEPRLAALPGPQGAVLEVGDAARTIVRSLAHRLASQGGAAVLVDYGHVSSGFGDTLQAVRAHSFTDPLANPGEADLTAHIDFAALARAAQDAGVVVSPPIDQSVFLGALGIGARATRLRRDADDATKAAVDAAEARLTDRGPTGMGRMFKVLGLAAPGIGALAGWPPTRDEAAGEA